MAMSASEVAVCQRAVVAANDPATATGVTAATGTANGITVNVGAPGWVDRLLLKMKITMCIRNFQKMLKTGRVFTGDPRTVGAQAATTGETNTNGAVTGTSGVGIGREQILLGPDILNPTVDLDPFERGQKFIHEGCRTKQRWQLTAATLQPNGQPSPDAPGEERCRYLWNEYEVFKNDADYYDEVANQAAAADKPAFQRAAKARRDHANAVMAEIAANC
jgi:hypothetical protein